MLLANYVTSAWRNILRHKLFSIINIMGLAIGLAAVMLIAIYVRYETSYDSFWKNADNIYRMEKTLKVPGQTETKSILLPGAMRSYLIQDFPEVEYAARYWPQVRTTTFKDKIFQQYLYLVDPEITKILSFNSIYGNSETALNNPNGLILNKTESEKYFGDINPLGENITVDFGKFTKNYVVSAVIEDIPEDSMIRIPMMVPLIEEEWKETSFFTNWLAHAQYYVFSTIEGTKIDDINKKMPDFIDRYFKIFENIPDKKKSEILSIKSLNIRDLHLLAEGIGEAKPKGSMITIILFSAISFFILLIASINFMNLSTARATARAKEVSLRKTVGASRKNLIFQFLGESVTLSLISLLIAFCLVEISLPFYNQYINKEYTNIVLTLNYLSWDAVIIIGTTLLVGALGGIYPALVLSSFHPSKTLRANKSTETKNTVKFRNYLVITQFSISIMLFVASAVVYGQLNYIKNIETGYDEENLITIDTYNFLEARNKKGIIINEISKLPNITNVTTSNVTPGRQGGLIVPLRTEGKMKNETTDVSFVDIDYDFFNTYGVNLLAGREFASGRNDEFPPIADLDSGKRTTASLIINQSALRLYSLGTPEEAIGQYLYRNLREDRQLAYEIIGVIPDIYFDNLKEKIRPEIYWLKSRDFREITVRYTGSPTEAIKGVESAINEILSGTIFMYQFLDEKLMRQYESEQNQMTMFAAFSGLAIFIACLGLFGLASFTAERRTKEIGIRKVFGAEIFQIVKLLVWQFSKPVLIANIIAWPIAYLAMSRWLESFVYRIDDMVIIALCLIAGLAALLIAWATVAGNSYTVARQNPIKALRYE